MGSAKDRPPTILPTGPERPKRLAPLAADGPASDEHLRETEKDPGIVATRAARARELHRGMLLADRFEIDSKLGTGGMGHVFAAFDRALQMQVALKVLGHMTPTSSVLLKREFRAASELVHPNLVRFHGLFVDGSDWFFTMDLVTGQTLAEFLKHAGLDGVGPVFGQLAAGLDALHRAGTIHGDLKPSNFLVAGPHPRVILLDFGLARPIGGRRDDFAGTPGYSAPEQFFQDHLTASSDWYSFGVVLYEALTGTLPFGSPSRHRLSHVRADVRDLCLRLLSVTPADRPSAVHVLACFGVESRADKVASLPTASVRTLVDRIGEIESLDEAFEATLSVGPGVVLIDGPSGIGKTTIVQHFVERAEQRGARVLAGRCREREAMSYKAVDGLIEGIVDAWNEMADDNGTAPLPHDVSDLTVLFPALRAADAIAPLPEPQTEDQAVVKVRAIAAFRMMLQALARRAPLIVWLDDLQWSDAESALLLAPLLGDADPIPMLLIGTYRTMPGSRGPLLDALEGDHAFGRAAVRELTLGPLPGEDAEQLARRLLPNGDPHAVETARTIARDSGGHPLFVVELAHTAASAAGLHGAPATTLSELLSRRVAALPPTARGLLEAAAIAGTPLPRNVLRRALGMTLSKAQEGVDLLRANRLAKSQGPRDDDDIEILHDRIREIVVAGVTGADRKRCHLGLAEALESWPDSKPDLIATHYQSAGEPGRAARHWLIAAEQAHKALAFARAASLYGQALAHGVLDDTRRHSLQVRRAEALAQAGQGPDAADAYLQIAGALPADEGLELRRLAAEQLLLSGHFERGLIVMEPVLRTTRLRNPRGGRRALAAVVLGRLLVRWRGLKHVPRSESTVGRQDCARLDACWTIACSLALLDPIRGADFQTRHLRLALKAGEPRRLLRALTLEVSYAATPGFGSERRTSDLLSIADALAARGGDSEAIGMLALARGIAAYLQGRLGAALHHCEKALDVFQERCAGAVWQTMSAQRFVIASLFFLGKLRRLSEFVPPLLAGAEGTGNLYASICFRSAYSTLAWLTRDDVEEARKQLRRSQEEGESPRFSLAHYNSLLGQTYLDMYLGDIERAEARLRERWSDFEAAQLLRIGVIRVQLWQLRGACSASAADRLERRGQRVRADELRREARASTARLRKDRMGRARPLAGLVDAALSLSEGDRKGAERSLRRSIQEFDSAGLAIFAAAGRVRRGETLAEAGWRQFRGEGVVNLRRMLDLTAPGIGG